MLSYFDFRKSWRRLCVQAFFSAASLAVAVCSAQAPSSTPKQSSPPQSGSSGFSIETEMLTYRALESDSEAVACDVAGVITGTRPDFAHPADDLPCTVPAAATPAIVVLLPFEKTELEDFAQWRAAMAEMKELQDKAETLGCPRNANKSGTRAGNSTSTLESFLGISPAGPPLALAASVLDLFKSQEAALSVSGNIQDLAFLNNVARQLKVLHIAVVTPSSYDPGNLSATDEATSPFLASRERTLLTRGCLMTLKPVDDQNALEIKQAISDIDGYMATYAGYKPVSMATSSSTTSSGSNGSGGADGSTGSVVPAGSGSNNKNSANQANGNTTGTPSALSATLIEDYMATFAGSQSAQASKPGSTTNSDTGGSSGPRGTGTQPQPNAQTPFTPSSPGSVTSNGSSSTSAESSINIILRADGLAQKLGFTFDHKAGELIEPSAGHYVLMVKALESGGSVTGTSNIFGTRLRYSGGAVGTYALFDAAGELTCSGNVYDYGGSLAAKHFERDLHNVHFDPSQQVIFRTGGCPASNSAASAIPASQPIH
jgi:hypothetical protein